MGRRELVAAIEKHGGYVTPGVVAEHLGYCLEGTVEFMVEKGLGPHIRSHTDLRLDTADPVKKDWENTMWALHHVMVSIADSTISARPKGFSSTYRRWKDIVGRDTLTNSEVTYLGHRLGEVLGGNHGRSKLTKGEAYDLLIHVMWHVRKHGGYKLTYEQVEKGKAWLARRDVQREIQGLDRLDAPELAEIARTVADFRFVGFAQVENGNPYRHVTKYKPLYEARSPHGSFVYRASPWVDGSGMRLEIY